jgi:hypothetical protein
VSSNKESEDGLGISKIKKKLSLKVVIPDSKLINEKVKSIDSEPKVLFYLFN